MLGDCNDPAAPSCGYYPLETAIDDSGERVSALTAYLSKTVAQQRIKHLSVCTGTVASRLEIGDGEQANRFVTGVHIRPSTGPHSGKDYLAKAKREVILCCGAMNTPQLLLLSGIGPRDQKSEVSLNIPLVKELPAVGAAFSDHYAIPVMLELPKGETLHILETAIWGLRSILLWICTGTGLMSLSSAPTAIFLRTDSIDEATMQVATSNIRDPSHNYGVPDVKIMMIPLNSLERHVPGRSLFPFFPTILQSRAKGILPTYVTPKR